MKSLFVAIENAFNKENNTALKYSAYFKNNFSYRPGDNEILKILDRKDNLSFVKIGIFEEEIFTETPLTFALQYKRGNIVIKRLIDLEQNINTRSMRTGNTALAYAVYMKYSSTIVREILRKGARVDSNLLYEAVSNNNPEIVELLIDAGADSVANDSRNACVFLSIRCKGCKGGNCRYKQTIDVLIRHGFDLKQLDDAGNSIIHEVSCIYLINSAIKCGVNVDIKNESGSTPLHFAVSRKNEKKVHCLIQHGANANCLDLAMRVETSEEIVNLLFYNQVNRSLECVKRLQVVTNPPFETGLILFNGQTSFDIFKHMLLYFDDSDLDVEEFGFLMESDDVEFVKIFFLKPKQEISKMKETFIVDDLTFYEFCMMKIIKRTKLVDISSVDFKYNRREIDKLFPIYGKLILMRINGNCKQMLKKLLVNGLQKITIRPRPVRKASRIELNYDCLYHISKYLSVENLHGLFCLSVGRNAKIMERNRLRSKVVTKKRRL